MGTTFVSLSHTSTADEVGFWMRDELLELWLRLLALHLPEPNDHGEHLATVEIRNQWLLASRGYFTGCVPHGMEDACATKQGRDVVLYAIHSLLSELNKSSSPLDADTMNLLGNEGCQFVSLDRHRLKDIGQAFLDLLDGRFTGTVKSTEIMPGSTPYRKT